MAGLKRVKEDAYNGTSIWDFGTRDKQPFTCTSPSWFMDHLQIF